MGASYAREPVVVALVALPVAAVTVTDGVFSPHATVWVLVCAGPLTVCVMGVAAHIRRIPLAQGLGIGLAGAAIGLVAGAAVAVLGAPFWEWLTGESLARLRFDWLALAAGALLAVAGCVVGSIAAVRS